MEPTEPVRIRLRAEFVEMPGLCLTVEQVQRLCGLERTVCQMVLDVLVAEQFLCVTADDHYARPTTERHRPAKAYLRADPLTRTAS